MKGKTCYCYCYTCKKAFHRLGIARHRVMHRDKNENCKIEFTNGDISIYNYNKTKKEEK